MTAMLPYTHLESDHVELRAVDILRHFTQDDEVLCEVTERRAVTEKLPAGPWETYVCVMTTNQATLLKKKVVQG